MKTYLELTQSSGFDIPLYTIPVVVHVIHFRTGQDPNYTCEPTKDDISDEQIKSQIDALNQDFMKLTMAEIQTVNDLNSKFGDLVAVPRIRFMLAGRTPDCKPTGGIVRTYVDVDDLNSAGFDIPDTSKIDPTSSDHVHDPINDTIKHDNTNGQDAWPTNLYLNIWVSKLRSPEGQSVMGYGSFPGWPEEIDGIVMDYRYFGSIDRQGAWDRGRRLVHEVGHYLNLFHIWGNSELPNFDEDIPNCNDDDYHDGFVVDTPKQFRQNDRCPFYSFTEEYYRVNPSNNHLTTTSDFILCDQNTQNQTCQGKCRYFPNIDCTRPSSGSPKRCNIYTKCYDADDNYIWNCSGIAQVAGQSAQEKCPAFPHRRCPTNTDNKFTPVCDDPGYWELFFNHMDYTQDRCSVMFTTSQVKAMEAAIKGPFRRTLIDSIGLYPPPGATGADLWIRHSWDDLGIEPDTRSTILCASDDIWVNAESHLPQILDHENPVPGQTNLVFVRVRNRGCGASTGGTLFLYWAKASSALSWPSPWNGYVENGVQMGGMIGSPQTIPNLNPGDSCIMTFEWTPPDPANYSQFGDDRTHFCLLARIQTSNDEPYGMTHKEDTNLWENVRSNNNIAWKNVIVAEITDTGDYYGCFRLGCLARNKELIDPKLKPNLKERAPVRLKFIVPEEITDDGTGKFPGNIFDWGIVEVEMKHVHPVVKQRPFLVKNKIAKNNTVIVDKPGDEIDMEIGLLQTLRVCVRFKPKDVNKNRYNVLPLDIIQMEPGGRDYVPVGGMRIVLKTKHKNYE